MRLRQRKEFPLTLLAVAVMIACLAPVPASAQVPEVEVDLDLLVEMPLATALALDAGVPEDDVAVLANSLIEASVPPRDFLEVLILAPAIYGLETGALRDDDLDLEIVADLEPGDFDEVRDGRVARERERRDGDRRFREDQGMGAFVQAQLDRGLRGQELAAAIHRELRRRGVPAGPKGRFAEVRGGDLVVVGGALPRDDRDRLDGLRRRGGPPGRALPPGQAKKAGPGRDVPPGQAKKDGPGRDVPPGQAKKDDRRGDPPGQAGKARGRGKEKGGPPPHAGPDDGRGGPPGKAGQGRGRGKEKGGPPPHAGGEGGAR